jgi:hypothetical protein
VRTRRDRSGLGLMRALAQSPSRPGGPTAKHQPSPEGLGWNPHHDSERHRSGTHLVPTKLRHGGAEDVSGFCPGSAGTSCFSSSPWSNRKSDRRAAPIFFGPCTPRRTWGTRPISSPVLARTEELSSRCGTECNLEFSRGHFSPEGISCAREAARWVVSSVCFRVTQTGSGEN